MSEVNKTSAGDVLHAVAKAGLNYVPVIGAAAAELFGLVVTPPLEKRRQAWMNEIADRIKALEGKGINLEGLSQNEQFIDTILQATAFAIKTSDQEKLDALKNAVVNVALQEAPDKSKSQVFLALIDRFTVWHIKILSFFDNPKAWFEKAGKKPPTSYMGSMSGVLTTAFPGLAAEEELVNVIWDELHAVGFHRSSGLKTMMSGDGALAERTTSLGKEFIQFITAHS